MHELQHEFETMEARDEFLDRHFPTRECQESPGHFALEPADGLDGTPAGELFVFCNTVTFVGTAAKTASEAIANG